MPIETGNPVVPSNPARVALMKREPAFGTIDAELEEPVILVSGSQVSKSALSQSVTSLVVSGHVTNKVCPEAIGRRSDVTGLGGSVGVEPREAINGLADIVSHDMADPA